MSYWVCSRCKKRVEYACIFHFKSVRESHTLLSIQMCMDCRDEVFAFITEKPVAEEMKRAMKALEDALIKCKGLCRQPNARFWIWWNNDYVKMTMRPGSEFHLWRSELTDEGYCSEGSHYTYEDGFVSVSGYIQARDCDGRLDHYYESHCHEKALQAAEHFGIRDIRLPKWEKGECIQRDYAAERMGY